MSSFLVGNLFDWVIGEPNNPFHPVRGIGALANKVKEVTLKFANKKLAGILTWLSVILIVGAITILLSQLAAKIPYASFVFESLLVYFCVSAKGLIQAGDDVVACLKRSIHDARQSLKMIVGRDVEHLNKTQILRAVIETCSENICDGIIAPMFYYMLLGPLGMILYKAVNTMDSMFGHRNEEYLEFGFCSAKMDDFFNFIPARLSSVCMIVASACLGLDVKSCIKITLRDRLCHLSPNSGHSEASAAGALRIQLGGANTYFHEVVEKETIGDDVEEIDEGKVAQMRKLLMVTTLIMILIVMSKELIL